MSMVMMVTVGAGGDGVAKGDAQPIAATDRADIDRRLTAARFTNTTLASLARRRPPRQASRNQAVRHAEIRRLAVALREAG